MRSRTARARPPSRSRDDRRTRRLAVRLASAVLATAGAGLTVLGVPAPATAAPCGAVRASASSSTSTASAGESSPPASRRRGPEGVVAVHLGGVPARVRRERARLRLPGGRAADGGGRAVRQHPAGRRVLGPVVVRREVGQLVLLQLRSGCARGAERRVGRVRLEAGLRRGHRPGLPPTPAPAASPTAPPTPSPTATRRRAAVAAATATATAAAVGTAVVTAAGTTAETPAGTTTADHATPTPVSPTSAAPTATATESVTPRRRVRSPCDDAHAVRDGRVRADFQSSRPVTRRDRGRARSRPRATGR